MAIRITQIPVETSIATIGANIRITQIPIETSIANSNPANIRVTQIAIETSIAVTQAYQLSTWENDAEFHAIVPYSNKGFVFEDDVIVPVVTPTPSAAQPVISIMT